MEDFSDKNQVICKGCKKSFYVSPADQKKGRGNFCTAKCYYANMSKRTESKSHRLRKAKRRTEDFQQKVIKMYQEGISLAQIAKRQKCHVKVVHTILDKHNIPRRTPKETKMISFRKYLPLEIEMDMIRTYKSGESALEVNRMFGYPRGTMEAIIRRNKIPAHPPPPPKPFTEDHRRKISENHHDISGKNNPMYGKSPPHGKWVYVKHLRKKVRSTWERDIALVLHGLGIKHKYENNRIYLKGKTYMPDFYLPDYDLYIEVKGWMNSRSKRTLRKLFREKPHINLLVISSPRYKAIMNNADFLIMFINLKRKQNPQYHQLEFPI